MFILLKCYFLKLKASTLMGVLLYWINFCVNNFNNLYNKNDRF